MTKFALLLEDFDVHAGAALAEHLAAVLHAPLMIGPTQLNIRASIGIALADATTDGSEVLMREADAAMYLAKQGGKNSHRIFEGP